MNDVIYKDDEEYPELLRQIGKGAPKQLYFKGAHTLKFSRALAQRAPYTHQKSQSIHSSFPSSIFKNCLAVVGSRKLTHYGKQAVEQLIGQVASAGVTIVSGFMYGGDAAAHRAAVKVGGRTIAVMPCGIDLIHPEDQEELYNDILDNNGLIISEYEGEMKPALWTYPQRNRIVAGLSKALLVIEAGEKSGSLITANYAKKFKRKVFAAPGPITSSVSIGTNALIKQGAEMVLSARDILDYFYQEGTLHASKKSKALAAQKTKFSESLSPPQQAEEHAHAYDSKNLFFSQNKQQDKLDKQDKQDKRIIDLLAREPLGIDELSRDLEMPVSELSVKLSMMEIQGLIELKGDKYYAY